MSNTVWEKPKLRSGTTVEVRGPIGMGTVKLGNVNVNIGKDNILTVRKGVDNKTDRPPISVFRKLDDSNTDVADMKKTTSLTTSKSLGQKIALARSTKGFETRSKLAVAISERESVIADLENGKTRLSLAGPLLIKINRALGTHFSKTD